MASKSRSQPSRGKSRAQKTSEAHSRRERYQIVHENEAGEALERGTVFDSLCDGPHYLTQLARSCNVLEGDALRLCVVKPNARSRAAR